MAKIQLTDLTPGNNYSVQLRAVGNNSEVGAWSKSVNFVASVDALAPKPVTSLTWGSGGTNGTAFLATWVAPTQNADNTVLKDLHHYKIVIADHAATFNNVTYITTSTRFDFSFEMNAAAFGAPKPFLDITVYAVDAVGNQSTAASASYQNPPPSNPIIVAVLGMVQAIQVSWDAITDIDLNNYDVSFGPSNTGPWTTVWSGLATNAVIPTNIFTPLYARVRAFDVFGQPDPTPPVGGPATATSPFIVDITAPGQPASVTTANEATDNHDISGAHRQIEVDWATTAAADLAGFLVSYKRDTDGTWTYISVPDITATSVMIHGLLPNSNYIFRVQEYDFSNNYSGATTTGIVTTSRDTTPPNTPAAPTAVGTVTFDSIQVKHSMLDVSSNPLPSDMSYLAVYFGTSPIVIISDATYLGNISVAAPVSGVVIPANGTFAVPAAARTGTSDTTTTTNTYYIAVTAVDATGNISLLSPSAPATVGLISGLNVASATITDANINDLTVTKLTAGTGLVNNFTVFSTLTLGTSLGPGTIVSSDYLAGANGFKLSTGSLEINQGTIRAASILLQNSDNLLPNAYADFSLSAAYYTTALFVKSFVSAVSASATHFLFPPQSLMITPSGPTATLDFTPATSTFNINIQGGSSYIVSAGVYQASGTAQGYSMRFMDNGSGSSQQIGPTISVPSGVFTRISASFPTSVSATAAYAGIQSASVNVFWIDEVQVEWQSSQSTTPSPWQPPSITTIDGGMIKAGSIQSTNIATYGGVSQPDWVINLAGNATFNNALIRGTLIVGQAGDTNTTQLIRSQNYVTNVSGWKIDATGAAEFQNVVARGTFVTANGLSTGGSIQGIEITSAGGDKITLYSGDSNEFIAPFIGSFNSGVSTFYFSSPMGLTIGSGREGGQVQSILNLLPSAGGSGTATAWLNADLFFVGGGLSTSNCNVGSSYTNIFGCGIGGSPGNYTYLITSHVNSPAVVRVQDDLNSTNWAQVSASSFNVVSSEYLKTNIIDYSENSLDHINALKPKTFKRLGREQDGEELGFVAEDVEAVIPNAINKWDEDDGEPAHSAIAIMPLLTTTIHAIQQLSTKVDALEKRLDTLKPVG